MGRAYGCEAFGSFSTGDLLIIARTRRSMDDDDIYGGLDAAASSAETAGLREQLAAAEAERDALRADAGAATAESARLREANETLERNISVLFNTAKAEIARKDRQIEELAVRCDTRR